MAGLTAQLDGGALGDRTEPRRAVRQTDGAGFGARLRQSLWLTLGQRLFRLSFHNWYRLRNTMLRLFGADIAPTARIRPTARISHPSNLTVEANATIGDHAVLNCLGRITIGARCTISQYSHLCAASHNHADPAMPLITDPITIGADAWIAADVFVGPGVTVGEDTVVGSRSTVLRDLPGKKICAGDNARPLADRIIKGEETPTPDGDSGA